MRTAVGGIGCPDRSSCRARARKQAGRRSSSSLTGMATTKPGGMGEASPSDGKGKEATPTPDGSSNIESPELRGNELRPPRVAGKNRSASMKFRRATFGLRNHLRAWPSAGSAGTYKNDEVGGTGLYAGTRIGRLGCGHSCARIAGTYRRLPERTNRSKSAHTYGVRRCAFLFCTQIQSPRASGRRCIGKSSKLCVLAATRSTIATSTPNPLIRSWVSRRGCNTMTSSSTGRRSRPIPIVYWRRKRWCSSIRSGTRGFPRS